MEDNIIEGNLLLEVDLIRKNSGAYIWAFPIKWYNDEHICYKETYGWEIEFQNGQCKSYGYSGETEIHTYEEAINAAIKFFKKEINMEDNIIEGNILIAEFDGKYSAWKYKNEINEDEYPFPLKYHSSWDWQIPVWNKIYEMCAANFNLTEYYEQERGLHSAIRLNQPEVSIPYLVELVKWYNKEQNAEVSDTTEAK